MYIVRNRKEVVDMVTYEDECVGCPKEIGCLGYSCPNRNVMHLYCDECNDDVEDLYDYNGKELCEECVLNKLRKLSIR